MADILKELFNGVDKIGIIQTIGMSIFGLILYYIINLSKKQSQLTNDTMMDVIRENRDMSEKQLSAQNMVIGKLDTVIGFNQQLIGHILKEDDDNV